MSLSKNLAKNLRSIRASRKQSLTDFAEEICISRSCLQTILKGESNLQMSTVTQIANRLNTNSLTLLQDPYSSDQLSHAVLLLDSLAAYQKLSEEDRRTAAELFHQLILVLDKAADDNTVENSNSSYSK